MGEHHVIVECQVPGGFAVEQVRGMFDLPAAATAREEFAVEVPSIDEEWQIGVIVGPSGSGKSSVAREVFGESFVCGFDWDPTKAVVDHFDGLSIKEVTHTLTAVGFSSPPAWIKPHHVLSGGERFRCDLARALLTTPGQVVAFDEFTSVVDRNVARVGSAAVAKSIRKGRLDKRFVAVTCHYDIIEWLAPDWVLDMASSRLARGCLQQRPAIDLQFAQVHRSAWQLFRRHHYLNHDLQRAAKCFVAFWNNEPVAFTSWLHAMIGGRRPHDMREHRTVVLPDYQGIGIGNRVSELAASLWRGMGGRALSTTSHPGMMHYRHASPLWRAHRFGRCNPQSTQGRFAKSRRATGSKTRGNEYFLAQREKQRLRGNWASDSSARITAGFEYIGPAMPRERAEQLLAARPDVFLPDGAMADVIDALADGRAIGAATLSRRSGYSITRVMTVLAELLELGHVERVRVGRKRVAWGLTSRGKSRFSG